MSGRAAAATPTMAGMHHSVLGRIENGEVTGPSADLLQRLADVLEVDSAELLRYIGAKPSLPEPKVYFRRAYDLSQAEAEEAARLIAERYRKQPKTSSRLTRLDGLEPRSSRRADFCADVGRGLAREPTTRGQAIRWLRRAEEAAPQWIRNSAAVRESVSYLLNRARAEAGGRELRGMAARTGIPH
jgi:transcriptional regulator with XRE-family HTH domain